MNIILIILDLIVKDTYFTKLLNINGIIKIYHYELNSAPFLISGIASNLSPINIFCPVTILI